MFVLVKLKKINFTTFIVEHHYRVNNNNNTTLEDCKPNKRQYVYVYFKDSIKIKQFLKIYISGAKCLISSSNACYSVSENLWRYQHFTNQHTPQTSASKPLPI